MNDEFFSTALSYLNKADRIIIGLSGGADSVCLTHILYKALGSEKLLCAHVNHNIRGEEANSDALFAENFAKSLGIEFRLLSADVKSLAKERNMGEEECGRFIRYEFFSSLILSDKSLIATAHNADDNAETLIMNLMRGCGTGGLCGIPFIRGNIIRPILNLSREEIEAYVKENNLSYVTDSTNNEDIYLRNKVRHNVIKNIKDICPEFTKNTFIATRLLSDDKAFLDSYCISILNNIKKDKYFDVSDFENYDISLKRNLLYLILKESGVKEITSFHIEKALNAVRFNSAVSLSGGKYLNVKQNMLTVTDQRKTPNEEISLNIGKNLLPDGRIINISCKNITKNEKIHNLLFNISLDCDKINGCLKVSRRKEGDKFTLNKRNVTKSLKKLFNEMKIPSSLRDDIIIIRDERDIVFIENIGVNKPYSVGKNTEKILSIEFL
ncbi:MAG: tRNA lysidine(34) synthetase TilS [Ruminococcaceae bacterium]|nr:tRNA lysidine(34) synthetase TilS [Oscillospiraceae bacterium]